MSISVSVQRKQFIDLKKEIPGVIDRINAELSVIGAATARRLVPKATRNLERSIGYSNAFNQTDSLEGRRKIKGSAEYGTIVDYAPYPEYGTVHQEAKPYMRPSAGVVAKSLDRVGKKYGEDF
jgi:hypothetical protein